MPVKVKVPKERMMPASMNAHNEMNDTKDVSIGQSRGEVDSINDTRLFLIIAQQTR